MTKGFWPFQKIHYLAFITLFCSFIFQAGCVQMQLPIQQPPSSPPQTYAEKLFINGDFENALLEFEHIYKTALDPQDKNIALYGLGCCQLMLARSDNEFLEAIGNLQQWDANKGNDPFVENHHLIVLALKRQGELIQEKNRQGELIQEKNLEMTQREARKNTLIENQRRKISQMATTLEKLQKQLIELEAMDETIQEKRRPL